MHVKLTAPSMSLVAIAVAFTMPIHGASLPSLLTPRHSATAVARPDGKVYILGGYTSASTTVGAQTGELYDPRGASSRIADNPLLSYAQRGLLLSGDRVLRCGIATCYVYNPIGNQWTNIKDPGTDTPLVTLNDGRVLMAGGFANIYATSGCYLIDPVTLTWSRTGDLTKSRYTEGIVRMKDGRVLVAGGWTGGPFPAIYGDGDVYDPATGVWAQIPVMPTLHGSVRAIALNDGTVLAADSNHSADIYDPRANAWAVVPGLAVPAFAQMTLLPDGQVLITGGQSLDGKVLATTTIFDPATKRIRTGKPLSLPRAKHVAVPLDDGTVLVIGGLLDNGQPTATVEKVTWEPRIATTLDKGFYIATSAARASGDGGFWGIEVNTPGRLDGGLNFGGSLPAAGADVGFAAFYLAEAQTVTGSVNFQPLGSGPFEVTLRLLDVNKQPVAPAISGGTHLEFSQDLSAGFYVTELQSSVRSPPAAYQFGLSAPRLSAGAAAGGVLDAALGVVGFAAFYLPERQDVTIRLYNENTYGAPRGAGEVILTLYDASGKIIARSGPGTAPIPPQ